MMTTASKKLITSRDKKGLHAVGLFETTYNKAQLDEDQAQRLNESPEFISELFSLIKKHSAINRYESEVVQSYCTYPETYKGPREITGQIKIIGNMFGLETKDALEYAKQLPMLPEGAEGWFAIPKLSAVATKHFPNVTDSAQQYCEALLLILGKIKNSRGFYNRRDGQINSSQIRQHPRTVDFLKQLEEQQPGDILIIAAQYGMRHRGKSVNRARETFTSNEFGLGAFAVGCMAVVHLKRYISWQELGTDCPGDEFSTKADNSFFHVPVFYFDDGRFLFGARRVSDVDRYYGSVSAFVSQ